jgi:hypothetical protein
MLKICLFFDADAQGGSAVSLHAHPARRIHMRSACLEWLAALAWRMLAHWCFCGSRRRCEFREAMAKS